MSFFVIKSAKQNSYRMDIFIATKIKSTYNKNIFSEFYKRIRSGWEISESDEKMWGVNMSRTDEEIKRYETKMKSCTTMTDLLVAMSSWQSYAQSHNLSTEEKRMVDEAYLKA